MKRENLEYIWRQKCWIVNVPMPAHHHSLQTLENINRKQTVTAFFSLPHECVEPPHAGGTDALRQSVF